MIHFTHTHSSYVYIQFPFRVLFKSDVLIHEQFVAQIQTIGILKRLKKV